MKKIVISFIALSVILLSCGANKKSKSFVEVKQAPTQANVDIILDYRVTRQKLLKLQYYAGGDIVLEKVKTTKGSNVGMKGKLQLKDTEEIDQVKILKLTPGTAVDCDTTKKPLMVLKVSFSEDKTKFLVFAPNTDYMERPYFLSLKTGNTVLYGGVTYTVVSDVDISLLWDLEEVKGRNTIRVEKGRVVQQ